MGGRRHYEEKFGKVGGSDSWKPSLKTGINPKHQVPRQEGCRYIKFKPADFKDNFERRHLRDEYDSLQGRTHDKVPLCLRPFEQANMPTDNEYNTEKTMG
jgi:hypothetical protein